MPKLIRTLNASYLPEEEIDDYHLLEEEEEGEEEEDLDDSDDTDDKDLEHGEDDGTEDEDEDEDPDLAASAEDDEDETEDEDEDELPAPKKSRANDRIRKLLKAEKKLKEENARLQAQFTQQTQQTQTRQNQTDPAAEAAYRASLSPEELIRYDVNKVLHQNRQQTELMQFQMQDMIDKNAFEAKASVNPVHKKFAAQVERKLLELRTTQRMNVPREVILANLIGERVLSGKMKSVSRKTAEANVKKNKTKTSSNRSDVSRNAATSGTEREKRRKRLEGVSF